MEKLVSILTPTYNCGHLIHRLLDSILAQTYPNVEMFVMDDGSTDNTKDVIELYVPMFQRKGYQLNYSYHPNVGLSSTINRGLKYINGDYLLWPDADDWYKEPYTIEKFVKTLESAGDNVGIARCNYEFIDNDSNAVIKREYLPSYETSDDLIEDAISASNDFIFCGWCVKTAYLEKLIPNREIFTSRNGGQNVQLIFPYLAHYDCITIDDVLFCYCVRNNSHSRGLFTSYDDCVRKFVDYTNTYVSVISEHSQGKNMANADEKIRNIRIRFLLDILSIDRTYANTFQYIKHFYQLLKLGYKFSKKSYIRTGLYMLFTIRGYNLIREILKRDNNIQ